MDTLIYVASIFFAGLAVELASIGSGIGQDTPFYIVGAILLIGLITVFCCYLYKYKYKEQTLITESKSNITESQSNKSQKSTKKFFLVIIIIEEDYTESSSSENKYAFDYENDIILWDNVNDPFPDLDRKLAKIVDQLDHRTFLARICETDSIVTCYLRPELYSNLTKPLMGGLVRLEYNSGFGPRVHYITQVIDSKIKEGSPWVWNIVLAEIIGEDEEMGERILYASLESEEVVPCKLLDYLRDVVIQDGDIVLLQVNETNRSFYYIVEIIIPYDSLEIT